MLVWPQRLLIPLLYDADSLAKTAKMMYRHQGLLKIEVLQAENLMAPDSALQLDNLVLKKSLCPFVELTMDR